MVYDPDRSHDPISTDEVEVFRVAMSHPAPKVGDRVLYRHDEHRDVTDALVLGVLPAELDDPNISIGSQHPWVQVLLQTEHGQILTREARVRGSAGWLPLSWMVNA